MSGFGVTPTAEISVGTGDFGFDLMLLARMGKHELVNRIVEDCKLYSEIVAEVAQDQLSSLELKRDEAIKLSRTLEANAAKLKQATFSARQQIASAENDMRRADNALAQLHYAARHSGLLTRDEIAKQASKIEQAKQHAQDAQFQYSQAISSFNMAVMFENEANATANNAAAEARTLDAQLRAKSGTKQVRSQGGMFIS